MLWDLTKMKSINKIQIENQKSNLLNTINTLNFQNKDENIFICGTRDGKLRLYDIRCFKQETLCLQSHTNKLNSACFSNND